MSFRIACAASYSYRPVVELTMPSWQANSGADRIDVTYYPDLPVITTDPRYTQARRWLKNAVQRIRAYAHLVREAVRERRRLLLLDADCYVLKPLSGGFDGGKPIAVARWPNPNIGVIFLDCTLDWPFEEFFSRCVSNVSRTAHTRDPLTDAASAPDQVAVNKLLLDCQADVDKLDARQWNFPYGVRTTDRELATHRDKMRILHLRIRHLGGDVKHEVIRRLQRNLFFSVIAGIDPRRRP